MLNPQSLFLTRRSPTFFGFGLHRITSEEMLLMLSSVLLSQVVSASAN